MKKWLFDSRMIRVRSKNLFEAIESLFRVVQEIFFEYSSWAVSVQENIVSVGKRNRELMRGLHSMGIKDIYGLRAARAEIEQQVFVSTMEKEKIKAAASKMKSGLLALWADLGLTAEDVENEEVVI